LTPKVERFDSAAKKMKKPLHMKAKANWTALTADSLGEQRCRISDKNRQVDNPSAVAKGTADTSTS
jgi:hypothetical protein